MLRYAALDLDGTLLDSEDTLFHGVLPGLRRLCDLDILPIIVTGRSPDGFRTLRGLTELLELCDRQVLLHDGDLVLDLDTGTVTCRKALPDAAVPVRGDWVACVDGRLVASSRLAQTAYAMAFRLPRSCITVDAARSGRTSRVTIFGPDPVIPAGVASRPLGAFGAVVLQPVDGGKAAGVAAHLADRFDGADLSRVIAIGDGDNDAALLAASAVGIAVQHSSPAAVASASVHLDRSLADYLMTFDKEGCAR